MNCAIVRPAGRLEGVLPTSERKQALEFVDHNEFGLAWEQVADALIERESEITETALRELTEIASLMDVPPTANRLVALAALAHEE